MSGNYAAVSDVLVTEVCSRRDTRQFINFPNELFKNVPTYIPPLLRDEMGLLTSKNPSLEHCDFKMFLAYRGKKVVGRVAAIINRTCNEVWNKKCVRFGWCDFIDDYRVFESLINKVIDFGKEHGMNEIEGPMGFTDMDKECWMINNFDNRQNLSTLYNPKYYIDFLERKGFEIKCRWQQFKVRADQEIPEKISRLGEIVKEKYNLRVKKFKSHKELLPFGNKFFHTLNCSFKELFDFVPLTEKEIDVYVKEYFPFANLDFTTFVVDDDDNLVAFGFGIPSLNKAYQKAKGRLFPFGWFHLLRALHTYEEIDLLLVGVHPDWQKKGVHAIFYADMNRNVIKHGIKTAYTNPQIMGFEAVKIWSKYNGEELMQRAVFGKSI